MEIKTSVFGELADGTSIKRYDMATGKGLSAAVMQYGATCISVRMPDKNGNVEEITLGFDSLDGYLSPHPYFGVTVGRFANRIGSGRFSLDGTDYVLNQNDGANHLHGGLIGFDKKVWNTQSFEENGTVGVRCSYESPDMEEGYPGSLQVTTTFTLTPEDELIIDYQAITDKPTPVNLTNHTYWNLAGGGNIYNHTLQLFSDAYLPVTEALIPSGERAAVQGTPFDFTVAKPIGRDIEKAGGFDHCWVVFDDGEELNPAAKLREPDSGRTLEVFATQPGIQFYSGNFLDGTPGRGGTPYHQHNGLCLETEAFPDAVNIQSFPTAILRPGDIYRERTVHRFSIT